MAPGMGSSTAYERESRKRVPKACDRCRLKKIKCDGNMPCPRCKAEDAVCQFGSRRKSTDRSVSAVYMEQLELQQRILVKALKAVWKEYAPSEFQANLGQDPSIHSIVKNLDELGIGASYRHLVTDFFFDGEMDIEKMAANPSQFRPSPQETRRRSNSSTNSDGAGNKSKSLSNGVTSYTSSPTFPHDKSIAPSLEALPPLDISNRSSASLETTLSTPTTTSSFRSNRLTFCPLPPKPNMTPVVPVPIDCMWSNTFDGLLPMDLSVDGLWQFTPGGWTNQCFAEPTSIGAHFDEEMDSILAQHAQI